MQEGGRARGGCARREVVRRRPGERPYILCTSLLIRNYLCTTYRKSLPRFRSISVNYIKIPTDTSLRPIFAQPDSNDKIQ